MDIFGPNALLPKVTYGAVTNQTQTAGTLNASVDLNGGPEVTILLIPVRNHRRLWENGPVLTIATLRRDDRGQHRTLGADHGGHLPLPDRADHRQWCQESPGPNLYPHAVAGLTTKPATEVLSQHSHTQRHIQRRWRRNLLLLRMGPMEAYGHTTPVLEAGTGLGPQDEPFELASLQVGDHLSLSLRRA